MGDIGKPLRRLDVTPVTPPVVPAPAEPSHTPTPSPAEPAPAPAR